MATLVLSSATMASQKTRAIRELGRRSIPSLVRLRIPRTSDLPLLGLLSLPLTALGSLLRGLQFLLGTDVPVTRLRLPSLCLLKGPASALGTFGCKRMTRLKSFE